jgi:multiple sugar transport system substrate-binding protein
VEPLRARNALADLTPHVKRDAKAFQPEDLNEATLLRARKDGKWHAIPLQMGLWFLVYNAAAFQQAGAGTPDASWTWDRYLEAVRTIMNRDPNAVGISRPPYELPVRGNGGDVLSADERKCLLDQPAAVEAIQWSADLQLRHRVVPTTDEMGGQDNRKLFDAGRLVAHIGDPGFLSQTQRGKLGFSWNIASVPRGKVARVSTVKGPSLVMTADSREKDTAWAWLLHYTSPEMQRYVAVEGKIVSARTSALKAFVALDEGYNKQVLIDMAAIARPMPYVARYDEMDQEIGAGLQRVYDGEPAKTVMAESARRVNDLLAQVQ